MSLLIIPINLSRFVAISSCWLAVEFSLLICRFFKRRFIIGEGSFLGSLIKHLSVCVGHYY